MSKQEILKMIEENSGNLLFSSADEVYIKAPDSFWAAISAPVILYKGEVVGVAFEKFNREKNGLSASGKNNDYIICGRDDLYISSKIWQKFAKSAGIVTTIEFDTEYDALAITIGQNNPTFFKPTTSQTSTVKYCYEDQEAYLNGNQSTPENLWGLAMNLLGSPNYVNKVEFYDNVSEDLIKSAILVDGQRYAPVYQPDPDSSRDGACYYSTNDDRDYRACKSIDQPMFKTININGKDIIKFIKIGSKIYVHEFFWDGYLGYDPDEIHYDISNQAYIYIYKGNFDAKYIKRSFSLPKNMKSYTSIQLKTDWSAYELKPLLNEWTQITKKSILIDGVLAVPLEEIKSAKMSVKNRKLYNSGKLFATELDTKTSLSFYTINDHIYLPLKTLIAAKIIGADSTKNSLTILGQAGMTGKYVPNTKGLKNYQAAVLVAQYQTAVTKEQRDAQAQQRQQTDQNQQIAAQAAIIRKQTAAIAIKAPDMNIVNLNDNEFGAYKISNKKLYVKIFNVSNNGTVLSSCYQQTTDQAIVQSVRLGSSSSGVLNLIVFTPNSVSNLLYIRRNNSALCIVSNR